MIFDKKASLEMLAALSPESLDAEIKDREELLKQMVGTLYPSIIRDEIDWLRELQRKRGK